MSDRDEARARDVNVYMFDMHGFRAAEAVLKHEDRWSGEKPVHMLDRMTE
jgi:hypothetical protein